MTNINRPKLAIVIPCYNEEDVIEETIKQIGDIFNKLFKDELVSKDSFVLFVDDGSKDKTWDIISLKAKELNFIKALKLSKNEGHQNALLVGMHEVTNRCDCMVSMDADLQQDPNAIFDMLEKFKEGYEIVLGIRNSRDTDTFFKRFTAQGYYKSMHIMGVDYRLMSNRALNLFGILEEKNIFIRGLVKLIGLKITKIYFENHDRFPRESKYTLKKMLTFAWSGITSFSVIPLKPITLIGFN